ncbi:hypothetical protein DTO006G1_5931 [Penicillium roqueforti]|uniref:uncharacterized protein n=1 Tax=Penicillium roqueforti TaxID=5082 RepID=UPI00190BBE4E|nr:uncharacterized protein LCP9604111_4070 [Penicillium roqueforti]KAF9249970.1 hypothetical protein LCP9604111_4070 [Penicillium roqueforti]KAI1837171.1 hypothetical protein CBS147337_2423 [Penicillium roqueforti]KAI2681169.1 hypothetical protein LCP963914a_6679 [Penicillium roqueforti]KAI2704590.1 hypothetical protein CBS147372_3059 [Penicillium roqueforti]KAI2707239.1 hypothetical protein CBS147332_6893 [Penicillium roqueforti]
MAPLKILVTGKSSVTHAPELGTLRFSVKGNGSEQDKVAKEVSSLSTNLQTWIKSAFPSADNEPDAPMTKFSSTSIRTWTKSTGRHDQPLPNPYHASISFKAVFRDFAELNHAIEELLVYPKVEIDSLDWGLTDETGRRLASDARKLALRDAIQQAADYSEVLGCSVSVVEISDQQASPYRTRHLLGACNSTTPFGDDSPALDLTPQDIDVESEISVTFEAETVTRSAPQTSF